MKRYFKFDKNIKKLIAQLSAMLIVSFFLFYGYKTSLHFYFIVLLFLSFLFVFFILYRIIFLNFLFDETSVSFRNLFKQEYFEKSDIKKIYIISLDKRKFQEFSEMKSLDGKKNYAVISKNEKLDSDIFKFSIFSIVNNDRMILEYSEGLDPYLNQLINK